MKTVREVAEELNISRQAVYSKLTVQFKENFTTIRKINNRNTLVIDKDGIEELKKDMDNLDSQADKKIDNQLIELLNKNIDILQKQLEVKDQQIIELNERLREAQNLNKNSQVLLHREQDQPKMIEEERKGFSFKRWFRGDK